MRWAAAAAALMAGCHFAPGGVVAEDAPEPGSDAVVRVPVSLALAEHHHDNDTDELSYHVDVPALADGFLVVSVEVGQNCGDGAAPSVGSVTLEGTPLLLLKQVVGTQCNANATRSAHFGLVAPPAVDDQEVVITLSESAPAVHSGVFLFEHVDPAMPVFGAASATGQGDASTLDIESEPLDLVLNTVGQGDHIDSAGAGQVELYTSNSSNGFTLDNTGASTQPGAATVTATWEFGNADEWQSISLSLRAR